MYSEVSDQARANFKYRTLYRSTPAMLHTVDGDGLLITVTDHWLSKLGFSREEVLGRPITDFMSVADQKKYADGRLKELIAEGDFNNLERQMVTKGGTTIDLIMSAISHRDESGKVDRMLVASKDVTERNRAESELRRTLAENARLREELERERDYLREEVNVALNFGRIVGTSQALRRMLKRVEAVAETPANVLVEGESGVGKELVARAIHARSPRADGRLKALIAEGDFNNLERQMLTKEGTTIDLIMSAISHRDESGKVDRMLVASKDVTERNRAESELRRTLAENARLREELERERDYLREEVNVALNFGRIVGTSQALRRMLKRVEAVAETPANVLVEGESGVGKELVARAIHARSPRADGPLVKVNCASIPKELFESEFFGHVRGAFTGAHRDRIGRFQLADGGTIFLDEVGEIPMELQGKLLRVLQESEFERVGDDITRSVDVRVIAATNRDLEQLIVDGQFREDLFYRLSVFPIEVPPLRERGDDVVQLAQHFLEQTCKGFGRETLTLSRAHTASLKAYGWPGNVRELKNVIERAVILSPGNTLRLDLSLPGREFEEDVAVSEVPRNDDVLSEMEMRDFQKANTVKALEQAHWKVSGPGGAAELLGVRPTTLADRIRTYKIKRPSQ